MAMKQRTGRSRVSKADQVVNKLDTPSGATTPAHTRVRPASKTDGISQKIPGASGNTVPTRVRPSSKADEISRKIPSPKPVSHPSVDPGPQPAKSPVTPPTPVIKPTEKKKTCCCLLPFTLGIAGIAAALIIIF